MCSNAEVVELLLAAGADALAERNDEGATPAHAAHNAANFTSSRRWRARTSRPRSGPQLSGASIGAET